MKKAHQKIIFEVTVNLVFFFIFFIFFRHVSFQPGDDEIFIGFRQQFSIGEFLLHYYRIWSGRIFNNFLIYILARPPILIWQIFMAIILTVFGRTLFFYFSTHLDNRFRRKIILLIICYLGIFLFSSAVLIPSTFWFTGSLSYFVPVVFAMLAFVPFFNLLQSTEIKVDKFWPIFIIPIVCAGLSAEQVSIGLVLIISGALLLAKIRRIKISNQLIFLYILLIAFSIVSITAPGNWLRLDKETQVWFSEYGNFNILAKITLAFGFSLTTIVNQWYYLMGLIWAASGIFLLLQSKKWSSRLISFLLLFYASVAGLRFVTSLNIFAQRGIFRFANPLFSFSFLLGPNLVETTALCAYFFWSLGILFLPIAWLISMKQNQIGLVLCFLYFVALFLIFVTGFSPTLFASGGRTGLVPNVILLVILIGLLWKIKPFLILVAPTIFLILFKMLTLIYRWTSNGYFVDYGLITMQNIFQH
jgi:hypothetical protein